MEKPKPTPAGKAMSDAIFDLLRLHSRILTAGDRLVASLGLTSARWQILGMMIAAERPQPVAWIARDMGANRQNVQRIVNDLARDGLVEFQPNPHHRRAQLVVLTDKGMKAYDGAMRLQIPWVNELAEGLEPQEIEVARKVIATLRLKLEDGEPAAER